MNEQLVSDNKKLEDAVISLEKECQQCMNNIKQLQVNVEVRLMRIIKNNYFSDMKNGMQLA